MKPSPVVVLVAPPNAAMLEPRIAPPLGLLNLVAWARAQGWDTSAWRVIDHATACYPPGREGPRGHWTHDFSIARCMAEIPTGADIYGVQLSSMQIAHGRAIAQALREREPQALLVAGGSHASALADECCDSVAMFGGHFDVIVEREGEHPFVQILESWDRLHRMDVASVEGSRIAKGGRGLIIRGEPVEPLDDLPFPARDMLDFSLYTRKIAGEPATNLISSRGCPARCLFCSQVSIWGDGAVRAMCSDRILAEVDHIYETTGIRNILFLDDSLTARKRSEMVKLCHGLAARGVKWRGWTRANLLARPGEDEVINLMAVSGCQALCVGVEAGTDKVLRAMDKGASVAQNRVALRRVAESGMSARCSIMVGSPSETWEDVFALVEFIESMREWVDDWILSSFVPLPGTPSWDTPEKFGLVIDKEKATRDGYRHFYVVGGDEQSGMVHSYADGTGPEDIQRRHCYVQEALLRLAPRDRVYVTQGRAAAK